MVTINANIETRVAEFCEKFNYYLFVFSTGCEVYKFIFESENCKELQLFTMNIDLPSGVYVLAIYGQSGNSNLNPNNATFLTKDFAKVINPNDKCFYLPLILNENNYPILNENNLFILYQ